jgi:hypothetical protein
VDFFGKFKQIKETGFGRENQLSVFSHLAQRDRLEPEAFCFWAKFFPTGDKKKKNPVRPIQRILFENFQKTRHIS